MIIMSRWPRLSALCLKLDFRLQACAALMHPTVRQRTPERVNSKHLTIDCDIRLSGAASSSEHVINTSIIDASTRAVATGSAAGGDLMFQPLVTSACSCGSLAWQRTLEAAKVLRSTLIPRQVPS